MDPSEAIGVSGPAGLRQLGQRRTFDREALASSSVEVARLLLGALLVRAEGSGGPTVVRVVETEAYHEDDPASHSHRGPTDRNAVMFGPPGFAYVYFTYGMHWCLNVSCEPEGTGAAVLLRAAVPLVGEGRIRTRRGPRPRQRDLLAGPARLTQALGVDRDLDGTDLCDPNAALRLETDGWRPPVAAVVAGPRVGIRHAADVDWRFAIADIPEVSRYSRHPRAGEG